MSQEELLRLLKDRLRVSVQVSAGPIPYESEDEVRVKVALLLDDEVISEDESSSMLPKNRT